MPNSINHTSDVIESIEAMGQKEVNLFIVDFEVIIHKMNAILQTFLESLPNVVIAIIIFGLFMLMSRVLSHLVHRPQKIPKSVSLVFERVSRIAILIVGFFVALAIIFPSIKPVDLLGGFGIASLAIGFAVKDLLNNFLSGILILLQQPFRVGDEIKHKDLEGTVDFIHIRYTVLIGYDGRKFLIPNGEIYSNIIVVNTLSRFRWSDFEINIDLNSNIEEASAILLSAIQTVEGVLKEPAPKVSVTNITSNAVTLKCAWATCPFKSNISKIRNQVLKKIKEVLNGENVTMPLALELFSQTLSIIPPRMDKDIMSK